MAAVRVLCVVALLGLSACRKMPSVQSIFGERHKEAAAAAETPRPPDGAASSNATTAPAKPLINQKAQVIVLGYHRFVDQVRRPDTEITPEDFKKQMQGLKDDEIRVIPLQQFIAWRHGEKDIPPKSAIITIDDGYNSAYDVAWPILKEFGYPFTLFIYTDYVKGGPKSGGGSLSWDQLAEMRDAGVDIQSHTVSHPDLRTKHHKGQDYDAWLWNELHGSKEILEQKLGIKVTALAVPFGRLDDHVKEVAAKAGYEMLFTVDGQKLTYGTPENALGRYMIMSNDPKIYASAVTFDHAEGAGGGSSQIAAQQLAPVPADGATIADQKPVIRANLAALEGIEPGSANLRLSGVGLLPAKFDPATKTISCQVPKALQANNTYTVIVSGRANGRTVQARWTFAVKPGETLPAVASGPGSER